MENYLSKGTMMPDHGSANADPLSDTIFYRVTRPQAASSPVHYPIIKE